MSEDDSPETGEHRALKRRTMLSALGVGAGGSFALSRWGGRGRTDASAPAGRVVQEEACEPCIDVYSGYLAVAEVEESTDTPDDDAETTPEETETPADEEDTEPFEPVLTVEARVTDADVVFPDEDDAEGDVDGTPEETPTATPSPTPGEADTPEGEGEGEGGGMFGGGGFPDFYFDPVGVRLRPGDVVAFRTVEEFHTVTAYHPRFPRFERRVPEGVVGFSSPVMFEGDTWYYRFDEPGVYDMLCLPHERLGMVVRAVVIEDGAELPEAPEATEDQEGGPSEIARTVLNASELEPQAIVDRETVAWTDLTGVESEPPL